MVSALETQLFEDVPQNLEMDSDWGTGRFRNYTLGDRKRFFLGGTNQRSEKRGFFGRLGENWRASREKWPLIKWSREKDEKGNVIEGSKGMLADGWKLLAYPLLIRGLNSINIPENQRRGRNMFSEIVKDSYGAIIDAYIKKYDTEFYILPDSIMPKIHVWAMFSEGTSTIDKLYTYQVTHEGRTVEVPVFFGKKEDTDINDIRNKVNEGINHVNNERESIYNEADLKDFFNDQFVGLPLDKYTRQDYPNYMSENPDRFHRWLVKDDSWCIFQYGKEDTQTDLGVAGVKVYKSPEEGSVWKALAKLTKDPSPRSNKMFWYWYVGDKVYDVIDTLFDPIQDMQEFILRQIAKRTGTNIDKEKMRSTIEREYKAIAKSRRGFFNPRPEYMTYSLN